MQPLIALLAAAQPQGQNLGSVAQQNEHFLFLCLMGLVILSAVGGLYWQISRLTRRLQRIEHATSRIRVKLSRTDDGKEPELIEPRSQENEVELEEEPERDDDPPQEFPTKYVCSCGRKWKISTPGRYKCKCGRKFTA